MNREIKFRIWDRQNKCMQGVGTMDWLCDGEVEYINNRLPDELVLMQFTGLKDKNGTEIYEGDIVKIGCNHKPGTYTVIWDKYRVAWWLKNIKQREKEHFDDYCQLLDDTWQDREVIGNIYENAELLK